MQNIVLSPPKLGFIVVTRGALALGVGLLLAQRLSNQRRRALGKRLVAFGALSTIPAALFVTRAVRRARAASS